MSFPLLLWQCFHTQGEATQMQQQSTEARAQEDPLLCPQMFSVLFLVVGGGWF